MVSGSKMVDVSVIIPTYNAASTIVRALESVAKQTCLPREIIVVNDGSNDQTSEIVRSWKKLNPQLSLTLIDQKNFGAPAARNHGIANATCNYIALLDSDDAWHPRKIERQLLFFQENPNFDLCCHLVTISNDVLPPTQNTQQKNNNPIFREVSFSELLIRNPIITPSVMFQKKSAVVFDSRLRRCDDHLAWLLVSSNGAKIACLLESLVFVFKPLVGGGKGLSSSFIKMQISEMRAFKILWELNKIKLHLLIGLWIWSLLKFIRRLLIHFRSKFKFLFFVLVMIFINTIIMINDKSV